MIFENYTFKKKFYALLVVFVMLTVAGYKRSFRTLFQIVSEYGDLSAKTEIINQKQHNMAFVSKQLASLDKLIGRKNIDKEKIQQEMIGFVTLSDPGIAIYDLQPIREFVEDNYRILTNQIDVTGNNNSLLKLAYGFETKFTYSKLVSLDFYIARKNNKPDVLHLKMTFQNYENIK